MERKHGAASRDAGLAPLTPCLVVGIGASVGGLEAFQTFFTHMPVDSGMAFVLIQHLAPEHTSILSDILGKSTGMTVAQAHDGDDVIPNRVFVIPPNAVLTIVGGRLHVATPAPTRPNRHPIDTFMFSLAEDRGEHAVCVILSGSGSDGVQGLVAVKEHGGITLAQAEFDETAMLGMPRNAADTGLVDHVLPVEAMPEKLIEYQRYLREVRDQQQSEGARQATRNHLDEVCALLNESVGHDFSQYKESGLIRRLQRRMQIRSFEGIPEYIAYLRKDPRELGLLFRDLLIGVTRFFRDPDDFAALETKVMPELMKSTGTEAQIRVWVPGCATGEEAYSIAILLREATTKAAVHPKIVIFATDINDTAIAIARTGRYHKSLLEGVSSERTQRWFIEDGDYFSAIPEIREMCVFSLHSVIKDPPFSRLHLISCRNLLIYLDASAQDRLIPLFHYALQPGAYLFLGPSESVTRQGDFFAVLDKKHRLFKRNDNVASSLPRFALSDTPVAKHGVETPAPSMTRSDSTFDRGARRVMEKYSPAYMVVDQRHQILRFSGQMGKYLEPSEGSASFHLFKLVQSALRPTLRTALREAEGSQRRVIKRNVPIEVDSKSQVVNVIVEPILQASGVANHFIIAFQDRASISDTDDLETNTLSAGELDSELRATRARLQAAIDEAEQAKEELRSAEEQYRSAHEEIQSSNEELEASKEELQSLNEELQTLNSEVSRKNEVLLDVHSDLKNFIDSSQIPMLFLNAELQIRNFTPAATEIFHLRDMDRGRPITDIANRIGYHALKEDVNECLHTFAVIEREVNLPQNGASFLMRIRPYRSIKGSVDGVVIVFIDISERKRHEEAKARLAAIVDSSRDAIISQTLDGVIVSWNEGATHMFGYTEEEVIGQPNSSVAPCLQPDEIPGLLQKIGKGQSISHYETVRTTKEGKAIEISLTISPIRNDNGQIIGVSEVARDITERQVAERHRDLLMGELDHRVKNTLATVQVIAMQTAQRALSIEDFRDSFEKRLMSLAQTHTLLTEGQWRGASLRKIVTTELLPYGIEGQRFTVSGHEVSLTPKQALALGLSFHELTTNAAKYGALSRPSRGCVDISWEVLGSNEGSVLQIKWMESGGPAVTKPRSHGFGSRLIERGLQYELNAEVHLDFRDEGVFCLMRIPFSATDPAPR
ncbi:chemotaxis protein CheB [Dyella monticola]|nr:chemotaxis protein CheB [Dyella monticola]